ncbi:Os09g0468800 [Oryza sativa Japonica Group]|uniref:Os09g0468800 protein n=1 Tax=Oryza sativa subsp. japonica TaxID=39947 RepID=Q0J122_ORYSJ|nr:Os09g0468800 [Oryza sativa Japonica Group]|eukprot:NP_001063429.2 Os09g0468800 [Oryza sativa Japonica Group]
MLYPERPSRVNGTATVDCSAYPLDCHPVCPGGSCYEIAEPPPPSPVVPRVDVAVDDHHLPDIHELKSNAVASPADLGRIHQIKVPHISSSTFLASL